MRDLFLEIWESIRRNKMRTCLTGFAVAWGIFMLIVLLGAGNGLLNSFMQGSADLVTNTMQVGGGWTSKPYGGLEQGRRIYLDEGDVEVTGGEMFSEYVDDVIATVGASVTISLGQNYSSAYIEGNVPERLDMEKIIVKNGRFINRKDVQERRKVVVLPLNVAETLMGESGPALDIVGSNIKVGGVSFLVVGVIESDLMSNSNLIFAPFSTVRDIYDKGNYIDDLTFSFHGLDTEEQNAEFEEAYKAVVNTRHGAAPDDESAIWIWNRFTQNLQMNKGMGILRTFLWVVGLFTLLSGIVGVSNIMLITVKERTHEFGIRKAIGASPWAVTRLIISESVVITAVFGYVGMFLGIVVCEVLDKTIGQSTTTVMDTQIAMLVNPTVGVDVALQATLLLIVAGTVAGLFPARRAAKVRPIEALRQE